MAPSSVYGAYAQLAIGLLICVGNGTILILFRKNTSLSKITRFLLANLAVGDMMFGILFLFRALTLLVTGHFTDLSCRIWMSMVHTCTNTSLGIIAITGWYTMSIVKTENMLKKIGFKAVSLMVALNWILGGVLGAVMWAFTAPPYENCIAPFGYFNKYVRLFNCCIDQGIMLFSIICHIVAAKRIRQRGRKVYSDVKMENVQKATTSNNR